ncbi:MAG: ATP-binding cassette domain-containing protein [Polyangiaceae bacterium]
MAALLTLDRLSKRFGAVRAVTDVTLSFERGRLHAVVGENGAGKTTLLKMAAGIVSPDRGEVLVDGVRLHPHTPREAIRRGVALVQQHFALVGARTALENVMLGSEPVRALGVLDVGAARSRTEAYRHLVGGSFPWDVPVERMGVGDRQRVAIVRALTRDASALILDEPTAVLTAQEADGLYAILRHLADRGTAIIVVTHRLDEVRDHADVVSVLRRGELVSTHDVRRDDAPGLLRIASDAMGHDALPPVQRLRGTRGAVRLETRDLRLGAKLRGVTLRVHAGEIVGVAGVEGNGQRELVRVLAGLDAADHGEVRADPVAVVHEDRQREGVILDASVRDNLVLGELGCFTHWGFVDASALDRVATRRMGDAGVVPKDLDILVRSLSGGNQQKIVVARALGRGSPVLVLAHPTRGVDLGAARAIHQAILDAADRGAAVLLVSADLTELRAVCDRILVMARGRVAAELAPDASDARFGEAMLGTGGSAAAIDEAPP